MAWIQTKAVQLLKLKAEVERLKQRIKELEALIASN